MNVSKTNFNVKSLCPINSIELHPNLLSTVIKVFCYLTFDEQTDLHRCAGVFHRGRSFLNYYYLNSTRPE